MSGFFDKLNDIGNMLDNVSGTIDSAKDVVDLTNHGVKKTQESGKNISKMIQRGMSEENERDRKKIKEYKMREELSIRRTVIFCVLVVLVTILICIFL